MKRLRNPRLEPSIARDDSQHFLEQVTSQPCPLSSPLQVTPMATDAPPQRRKEGGPRGRLTACGTVGATATDDTAQFCGRGHVHRACRATRPS
eukprot:2927910-Prymnesium_polylepis.1